MVGDFNSSPDDDHGEVYHPLYEVWVPPIHLLTGRPRKPDTWLLQKWHDDGFTSEFDDFGSDPTAELTTRIDHIFLAKQYAEREFSSFFGAAHQAADLE